MFEKLPDGLQSSRRRFIDLWSKHTALSFDVDEVLFETQSAFQSLLVLQTPDFGRMLVLDGNLQCAEKDEAAYHEFIVHPALCRAGAREEGLRVLIIGGGDGGAAREALRHEHVRSVELVDIDGKVMEVAREFLPTVWRTPCGKHPLDDDNRLHVLAEDGVAFLERRAKENLADDEKYDLVVVDASDPIGPGTVLYSDRFYAAIAACLAPKGAVTVQSGSWYYFPEVLQTVAQGLAKHFSVVKAYECFTAIYPGGTWNLCIATQGDDPTQVCEKRAQKLQEIGDGCDWYDEHTHAAAFALPRNAQRVLLQKAPSLAEVSERIQALS